MMSPEQSRSNTRRINFFRKIFFKKSYEKNSAFSLIELMIAISLMAITFFPMMELFTRSLSDVSSTGETTTILNLGREGMEMVRNLDLPVERLRDMKSYYYPSLKEAPIAMNNRTWRIHTVIHKETNPLQVDVEVIEEPEKSVRLVLTTLFEDLY